LRPVAGARRAEAAAHRHHQASLDLYLAPGPERVALVASADTCAGYVPSGISCAPQRLHTRHSVLADQPEQKRALDTARLIKRAGMLRNTFQAKSCGKSGRQGQRTGAAGYILQTERLTGSSTLKPAG